MFHNYVKIAIRNLRSHKGYTFINVSGLAIGMICCVLILLFVQDELSYDRYHEDADRIFRVMEFIQNGDTGERSASQPLPSGETLLQDYPHLIESSVRFFNMQAPALSLQYEDKSFNETKFFFTDPSVFTMFNYPFIKGNPDEALRNPFSLVITQEMAEKYFGSDDPIGKIVRFEAGFDFQVTGIIENVPLNSHFTFDFLASWNSLEGSIYPGNTLRGWYWNPAWTYIKLHEGIKPETLEEQFPAFIEKYLPQFLKDKSTMRLQPLTDIHLHSKLDFEIRPNSNVAYVYIFSGIAVFVLLIACINFMNLATSRSMRRAKEIGLRKVMGAYRRQLIKQFLGESVLLSVIAMIVAVISIHLLLPVFNGFTEKKMVFDYLTNWKMMLGMVSIALFVGIASGIYPAFFLSEFQPVKVLKGSLKDGSRNSMLFRKGLVVVQFAISIMLIVGTGTAYKQLSYLQNKNLGFDREGVILIPKPKTFGKQSYLAFKNRILENENVHYVSAVEGKLGIFNQTGSFVPGNATGGETVQLPRLIVDFDFLETFGMQMASGRSFTRDFPNDSVGGVIINEAAARTFGWTNEDAIGKDFTDENRPKRVVGVVKDFHFASLHNTIDPFVLRMTRNIRSFDFFVNYLAVRIDTENISSTLAFVEEKWGELAQGVAFEYLFVDDELKEQYRGEEKLGVISRVFSSLAIFVACLGLFALASFTAEQRTKEIGIRKVLGATVPNITALLSKEFTNLVIAANILAIPASYYLVNKWLQSFAYRVDIGIMVFIVSAMTALAIALLTVSYQSIKAALVNPIMSLRSE